VQAARQACSGKRISGWKMQQAADNGMRTASFLRFSICAKNEQVYT
jgi:hypothetical protein